jgi:hypothetical protein
MNIPLDNLYHYINDLFPEPICMYLFYPHGSRNILNVILLKSISPVLFNELDQVIFPSVICIDQEPLNYAFYQNYSQQEIEFCLNRRVHSYSSETFKNFNLKLALSDNIYDKTILIHSEQNSKDLEIYQNNGYIGVYYWCHAIIARDWYRFAEHDKRLSQSIPKKDFLIYCRDWSGSREYRIKFQELLHRNDLIKYSLTKIKKINSDKCSINNFSFKNLDFVPDSFDFLNYLEDNFVNSAASADYDYEDFVDTRISVVLETVFDGNKIHLTEKILRPIACGHPFILAAGPNSLSYLKSYGFKTFSPWINEDYDLEYNSVNRLGKIMQSMKIFSELSNKDKKEAYREIKEIADYNKKWFFSKEFMEIINKELINNINSAMSEIKKTRATVYRSRIKMHSTKHLNLEKRKLIAKYLRQLKKFNSPS